MARPPRQGDSRSGAFTLRRLCCQAKNLQDSSEPTDFIHLSEPCDLRIIRPWVEKTYPWFERPKSRSEDPPSSGAKAGCPSPVQDYQPEAIVPGSKLAARSYWLSFSNYQRASFSPPGRRLNPTNSAREQDTRIYLLVNPYPPY